MVSKVILGLLGVSGVVLADILENLMGKYIPTYSIYGINIQYIISILISVLAIGYLTSSYLRIQPSKETIAYVGSMVILPSIIVKYFTYPLHIWVTQLITYINIVTMTQIPITILALLSIIGVTVAAITSAIVLIVDVLIGLFILIESYISGLVSKFILTETITVEGGGKID